MNEIFYVIAGMGIMAVIWWVVNNNKKWNSEHPVCTCKKCNSKHRKGVNYDDYA